MLLLSTASLKGYGLHKIFVFAKKSGYDGLDLQIDAKDFDTWDTEYIKSLSDTFGVPVLSITAPEKGITKKKVDQIVDIAKNLGTQVITFSPPHIMDKNSDWFSGYLKKLSKDHHLTISVQNIEPKFLLFVIPEYRNNNFIDIKRTTGFTSLNISNVDKSSGTDILKALQSLGNTVRNVYLSDKSGPKTEILPGRSGGGTSTLPLESFLMKLRATSYRWYITLKVNPKELGAGENHDVIANLDFAKKYYEKHYKNAK